MFCVFFKRKELFHPKVLVHKFLCEKNRKAKYEREREREVCVREREKRREKRGKKTGRRIQWFCVCL